MGKWGILTIAFLFFASCVKHFPDTQDPYSVNLYNGIEKIAHLGETEAQVIQKTKYTFEKDVPPEYLTKVGFQSMVSYKDIGVKVYFQHGRVALIEMQTPFQGNIQNKHLKIFKLKPPVGKSWELDLIKEFGTPYMRASGGRFSSEALFYTWGDVSYNRNGPNEIAIYRLPEIGKWRATNFGREVTLFPKDGKQPASTNESN